MDNNEKNFFKLYYFFLINPDNVLSDVLKSEEYQKYIHQSNISAPDSSLLTSLFDAIFRIIFRHTLPYAEYLDNRNPSTTGYFGESFFFLDNFPEHQHSKSGRTPSPSYSQGFLYLLQFSILNHCIMQSMYHCLEHHTEASQKKKLNAANDYLFSKGIFELHSIPQEDIELNSDPVDKRAKYSSRYRKYTKLDKYSFSKRILESSFGVLPEKGQQKDNPCFEIPLYLNQWSDFIYAHRAVHKMDEALIPRQQERFDASSHKISNAYKALQLAENKKISSIYNVGDKFLFSYPMEYYYGFQTLANIALLLEAIQNQSPSYSARTYKDLEDHKFIDIIKRLFDIPLVYTRHLFLRYACDAVIFGDLGNDRYLSRTPDIVMSQNLPSKNTKIQEIAYGLSLIEGFLLNLTNVVIPLFTDLWNYTIQNINSEIPDSNLKLDLRAFSSYIMKYYSLITADFHSLSREELASCNTNNFQELRRKLTILLNNAETLSYSFTPKSKNSFLLTSMDELIQVYCDMDRLKKSPSISFDHLCSRDMPEGSFGLNKFQKQIKQLHSYRAKEIDFMSTSLFAE